MSDIIKKKKIFISHASNDASIGEKFLDVLVGIGVDKDEVFYTSHYHTGVKLGHDFHAEVKKAMRECEIVIFLLTRNFYKSEYCLYEMGAVWIMDKPLIPILLDNLTYDDMKGFIDSHYVAAKPLKKDADNLLLEFQPFIANPQSSDYRSVFNEFLDYANKEAKKNFNISLVENTKLSKIDKDIINGRFTQGELLFLSFFIDLESNFLSDPDDKPYSKDAQKIQKYAENFNFEYEKAKALLFKSRHGKSLFSEDEVYIGFELDIDFFRELLTMSSEARAVIESVKAERKSISPKSSDIKSKPIVTNEMEKIITGHKFREIEALLFQYIADTATLTLGARWMAENQKESIRSWEISKGLKNKLSSNYEFALNCMIYRDLVEVVSVTSYGNPREYKIKDMYSKQMRNLSAEAEQILESAILENLEEVPF